MKTFGLLSLIFILLAPAAHNAVAQASSAIVNRIAPNQAASLVRLAVLHQIRAIPHHGTFSLDQNVVEPDKRFLSYQAMGIWHPGDYGSAVVGTYSVNLRTAEVWDITTCKTIEFRQLRVLQERYLGANQRLHEDPPSLCRDY